MIKYLFYVLKSSGNKYKVVELGRWKLKKDLEYINYINYDNCFTSLQR